MKKRLISFVSATMIFLFIVSCNSQPPNEEKLQIMGRTEITDEGDTVYHSIADFQFVNQDSAVVTNETFDGKIYIADFFFTTCRTICPIMKTQMLRVYDSIQNDSDVLILSHTLDPEYDTVELLHDYADRLGVVSSKWHFVTGEKEDIYKLGQTSYVVSAREDDSVPDGIMHSGAFILVDKNRRIRGFYDGTKADQVNRLLSDLKTLKKEYATE